MENLPSEVLLQIFDLLDSENLRNVAVVCQRFQSLIHNDKHIMNKFRVCVSLSNLSISKQTLSDMPYRKFDIFASHYFTRMSLGQFEGRLNSVLEDHTENIENLRLYDATTGLASKILTNLENLTHLSIERIQKSGIEEDDALFTITLQNLKILEVCGVDSYLKCIRCPKVEILRYRNDQSSLIHQNPSIVSRSLNNFFKRSHNLKDFTMFGAVPNFEIEKFEFKLQKLKFTNYSTNIDDAEEPPMIKLLKSQKDNIEELTVTEYVTQNILEIAINEMKNLEKLKLDLDKLFAEPQNLKINLKLRKLEIVNLPNLHHHGLKVIKSCPNVEILKFFANIPGFILNEVSKSMKNLQVLTLRSVVLTAEDRISLNSLKKITFLEQNNQLQFTNIVQVCKASPNLSELEILNINHEMTSENLEELIENAKNVEILKLQGDLVYDDNINVVLHGNDTKLKRIFLDIEVDEYGLDLAEMLHETKVQCIIPDLIRTQRFYVEDRGASNAYLEYEIFDDSCDEETGTEDLELLDSGDSDSDESSTESEDSSDFYDENCFSCDGFDAMNFTDDSDDCSSQWSTDEATDEGSEWSSKKWEVLVRDQEVSSNFRQDSDFHNCSECDPGCYCDTQSHADVLGRSNNDIQMNLPVQDCNSFYNQLKIDENSETNNQTYFSKKLARNVKILESSEDLQASTSNQFRFYNGINNLEDARDDQSYEHEEQDVDGNDEDENDADDEQEYQRNRFQYIDEDTQDISMFKDHQLEELGYEAQENEESSQNRPQNQFEIMQVESLYGIDDNEPLQADLEDSQYSNDQQASDDQDNSTIENEESESDFSGNSGDLLVEISVKKRPRDTEQGISSEEDILIEITEGRRKIRRIC